MSEPGPDHASELALNQSKDGDGEQISILFGAKDYFLLEWARVSFDIGFEPKERCRLVLHFQPALHEVLRPDLHLTHDVRSGSGKVLVPCGVYRPVLLLAPNGQIVHRFRKIHVRIQGVSLPRIEAEHLITYHRVQVLHKMLGRISPCIYGPWGSWSPTVIRGADITEFLVPSNGRDSVQLDILSDRYTGWSGAINQDVNLVLPERDFVEMVLPAALTVKEGLDLAFCWRYIDPPIQTVIRVHVKQGADRTVYSPYTVGEFAVKPQLVSKDYRFLDIIGGKKEQYIRFDRGKASKPVLRFSLTQADIDRTVRTIEGL